MGLPSLVMISWARSSEVTRGSVSSCNMPRYASRFAMVAESAIAITIMSRPSSLLPIDQTLARGDASAMARM